MAKPNEIILWHDNNIVVHIENCDLTLFEDDTEALFPYRWLELETGQKFAELDGWHYRLRYNKTWIKGWEEFYEQ